MSSDLLSFFGLKDNPFKLEVILETFVGYKAEREQLINALNNKEKLVFVSGPTGAGKTTLLLWVFNNYNYKYKIFFYRPFSKKEEIEEIAEKRFSTFLDKILRIFLKNNQSILNKKQIIFFIDEATFLTDEMIEYLKTLVDHTKSLFVIAGLPELEEKLLREHRTFYERITTKIYLKSLDPESGKNLIKKRLEYANNPNLFTDDAIESIYKMAGGFPREILKISYECLLLAYKLGKKVVDIEVVEKLYEEKKPPETILKLTEKQRYIAETLVKYGPKTANELLKIIRERYNDMSLHALSNILKRMVESEYLIRTKVRGKYVYDITPRLKNYLIKEIMK
ncbi:MAG: AAA family ATPase [Nanopusillaceae archaeon]